MKPLLRLAAGLVLAVLACALPHLAGPLGVGFSGATYTSSSATRAVVQAAADWTPPTVSLTDPGTGLTGTVTLSASAADNVAVASVQMQVSPSGSGSWTTLCTATSAPWQCTWNTTTPGTPPRSPTARTTSGRSPPTPPATPPPPASPCRSSTPYGSC